jgi:hypothetical protein
MVGAAEAARARGVGTELEQRAQALEVVGIDGAVSLGEHAR